jgi:hypothetical protein
MKADRRLTILGVLLIVMSMTMATQYATTKVGYEYAVVHPSDADIRFVGSDNSSDSSGRVLRVDGDNSSGQKNVKIALGNWSPNSLKNYTAAFGVVNEEGFTVNLTYVNVSGTGGTWMDIWIHGDRETDVSSDGTAVQVVSAGATTSGPTATMWQFGAGNGDSSNMCEDGITQLDTLWDSDAHVRYSINNANDSINGTSDFLWFQVSLDIPSNAADGSYSGTIWVHFEATAIN